MEILSPLSAWVETAERQRTVLVGRPDLQGAETCRETREGLVGELCHLGIRVIGGSRRAELL